MGNALTRSIDVAARAARPACLRAVIYLRVSTEEQRKGYGIAYTGKKTAAYIERKGWEHVDTFKDEGESGTLPWQKRTNATRLMEQAHQVPRPFDVVVVKEGRAIGRKNRVFWEWVWKLADLGIHVAIVDEDIDNTTEDGERRMRDKAAEAADELIRIRTRTQGGIQEKAEDGGWPCGVPPFGWRIENQGKKGESAPALDDDDSATCHRARELRVKRKSYSQVAAVLNAEKRASRSGKPWTDRNVKWLLGSHALLSNEVIFRSAKNAKLDDAGTPVHGASVIVPLPPLFTDDQIAELKQAQAFLAGTQSPQREAAFYPASGRLVSPCGGRYTGYRRKGRAGRLYRCSGKSCDCSQIDADTLEAALWTRVCRVLGDKEQLRAMSRDWSVMAAKNRVNFADRIAELQRQVEEQDDTIDVTTAVAARKAARRKLSKAEAEASVERAIKPLEAELERLEKELAQVVEWQRECEASEQRIHDLKRLAEMAREHLHSFGPAEQAQVLGLLGLEMKVTGPVPTRPPAGSPGAWFLEHGRVVPALTDQAWIKAEAVIAAMDNGRGPKRLPVREVLYGILVKAQTGIRWEDLPESLGKPASIRQRWNRWSKSGAWEKIMHALEGMPGLPVALLPPIEMWGRLDPTALIGHMAAPEGSGSVEPLHRGAIRFQMRLAA
jgi:DNA invertase Pin-like site-specific DNA recombinase/transposase